MSLSRHLNREGISHADADSAVHRRHVRQRTKLKKLEWVGEPVVESDAAEFRLKTEGLSLTKGLYWVGFGETEKSASGPEFQDHCAAINWKRSWNFAQMTRGAKQSQVRRKRSAPAAEEFVINLSPLQMRFINLELARWEEAGIPPEKRKEMLTTMLDEIRCDLVAEFKTASSRDVVASYIHLDSSKIHFGIIQSRVGPENQLVGEARLGTVGPWSVGQSRLAKLGMVEAGDGRLDENLERFHKRFGEDRVPLDLRLHDHLDERFSKLVTKMGEDAEKRLETATEYYRSWKIKNRRDAALRSPSSQRVALQTVRLITPLLPPQVRTALSVVRTAVQVFQILGTALDAASSSSSSSSSPQKTRNPEITKIL